MKHDNMVVVECSKCGQIAMFDGDKSFEYVCSDCNPPPKPNFKRYMVSVSQEVTLNGETVVDAESEEDAERIALEGIDGMDLSDADYGEANAEAVEISNE